MLERFSAGTIVFLDSISPALLFKFSMCVSVERRCPPSGFLSLLDIFFNGFEVLMGDMLVGLC